MNSTRNAPILNFGLDAAKLHVIGECMDNYGVGSPLAEWPNNILSRKTVVYGSGLISQRGFEVRHAVDPDELAMCQRLAREAKDVMGETRVGMSSESDDSFREFFIAANCDEAVTRKIDQDLIRSKFAGTIFPNATITVEPFSESNTRWWFEVAMDGTKSMAEYFKPWRAMIRWFCEQPEFVDSAFVRIGDFQELHAVDRIHYPAGTKLTGCVLPRLALGLTKGGSLAGLFGFSVQT